MTISVMARRFLRIFPPARTLSENRKTVKVPGEEVRLFGRVFGNVYACCWKWCAPGRNRENCVMSQIPPLESLLTLAEASRVLPGPPAYRRSGGGAPRGAAAYV